MKLRGYDIEIIRGETNQVTFVFTDADNKPFILLNSDMFTFLQAHFKVKADAYSKDLPAYSIDKIFDLNTVKRFSDEEILNLQVYSPDDYNPLMWDDNFYPLPADMNRLFYHPDLNEYRYYNDDLGEWIPYEFTLTIPFIPEDTINLDYKEYAYDLVLEAGGDTVEYANVLVYQHSFVVSYRV